MFRFANIELLWLLLLIPAMTVAHIILTRKKRRQAREFGDPELVSSLMPNAEPVRVHLKFSLLMTALALLIADPLRNGVERRRLLPPFRPAGSGASGRFAPDLHIPLHIPVSAAIARRHGTVPPFFAFHNILFTNAVCRAYHISSDKRRFFNGFR